jgi:hypothetical protein
MQFEYIGVSSSVLMHKKEQVELFLSFDEPKDPCCIFSGHPQPLHRTG